MTLILPQLYMPSRPSGGGPMTYVGGVTHGFSGFTSGTQSLSLTNLTGGSNSSPSAGDFVVVGYAIGRRADMSSSVPSIATSGYTEVANLDSNTGGFSQAVKFGVFYKYLTTAETEVLFNPSGGSAYECAVIAQVFRNVSDTNPLDIPAATATGTGTTRPDPPASGTPTNSNAIAVALGGAGLNGSSITLTSSDLSGFLEELEVGSWDAFIAGGYMATGGSSVDPAQFGLSGGGDYSGAAWAAVTLTLRGA